MFPLAGLFLGALAFGERTDVDKLILSLLSSIGQLLDDNGARLFLIVSVTIAAGVLVLLLFHRKDWHARGGRRRLLFELRGVRISSVDGERFIPWGQFKRTSVWCLQQHVYCLMLVASSLSEVNIVTLALTCTKREAALIRNEIRRRIAAAKEKAQLDKA